MTEREREQEKVFVDKTPYLDFSEVIQRVPRQTEMSERKCKTRNSLREERIARGILMMQRGSKHEQHTVFL